MPDQPVDEPVDQPHDQHHDQHHDQQPDAQPAHEAANQPTEVPAAPAGFEAHEAGDPADAPAEPVHEKKSLSALKRFGVPVAVGLALIGFRVFNSQTAADRLQVGQCASRESDDSLKHRDCSDAKATYKVLFIKQDSKESAAEEVCAPYADTTTTYYEGTEDGSDGDLICLGDAK